MDSSIIVAIIGFVGLVIVSIVNWRISKNTKKQITEVHVLMNSRMDELLAVSKAKSNAEGNLEGREELKKEQDNEIK